MRFKLWLQENGPGGNGTMDNPSRDLLARAKDDAAKGVGAFNRLGDDPPAPAKSPTAEYLPPSHRKIMMKKKMKKR